MSRLILLVAIAALVYLLFKSYRKPETPPVTRTENMVRCARCGVHLPQGESLEAGGLHYCCAAHRDATQP